MHMSSHHNSSANLVTEAAYQGFVSIFLTSETFFFFFGFLCHRKLKVLLPKRAKYNTETSAVGRFLNHADKGFGEKWAVKM